MTRSNQTAAIAPKAAILTRIVLGALLLAGSAAAQMIPPQNGDLAASIPFSFSVGEETVPAGEYLLRVQSDNSILICEDGVYCNTVREAPVRSTAAAPALVFVKTMGGWRFAGLGEPANGPCEELETVQARRLRIDRFDGMQFAMAWR